MSKEITPLSEEMIAKIGKSIYRVEGLEEGIIDKFKSFIAGLSEPSIVGPTEQKIVNMVKKLPQPELKKMVGEMTHEQARKDVRDNKMTRKEYIVWKAAYDTLHESVSIAESTSIYDLKAQYEKLTGKKAPAGTSKQALIIMIDKAKRQLGEGTTMGTITVNSDAERKRRAEEYRKKKLQKEALDPVGKEDEDIDNDGDSDKSDSYLKNRRKAIQKAIKEADSFSRIKNVDDALKGKKTKDSEKYLDNLSKNMGRLKEDISSDDKVMFAARRLASKGKTDAVKDFGRSLLRQHTEHGKFTPDQLKKLKGMVDRKMYYEGVDIDSEISEDLAGRKAIQENVIYESGAQELGRKAFHKGIKRQPPLDPELGKFIDQNGGRDLKNQSKHMKAWLAGWDKENLKSPVESVVTEARKKKSFVQSKPTGFRTGDRVDAGGRIGYVRSADKQNATAIVEFGKGEKEEMDFEELTLVKTAGGVPVKESVIAENTLSKIQKIINEMGNGTKVVKDKSGFFHIKEKNSHTGPFSTLEQVLDHLEDKE